MSLGNFGFGGDQRSFSVQLPHTWREGTNIYPHVHWCPIDTDTGFVRWGLEYMWANIDTVIGNTVLITTDQAGSGVANTHQLKDFAALTGTGKTASSMLLCRIYRDAAADDYDNDAALLEIDFHYQVERLGEEGLY